MTATEFAPMSAHATLPAMSAALKEAVLSASSQANSAGTARLKALAMTNNPRFWDPKIRSEQWFDTSGSPFTLRFPAILEPAGKHSRLDPYFTLPTMKQPELKDVRTVKAQFQLRALDDSFPPDAVVCSKKAENTMMWLVSTCERARSGDRREVIQFLRNSGNSSADPLHFVLHSEPLFPEAAEASKEIVPEFSMEDFENTKLTFSGNILKQKFGPKLVSAADGDGLDERGIHDWSVKDMPDPLGHYKTVMNMFNVEHVPVVVPDVRDASGALIHPADYGKNFTGPLPVVAEVVMRVWTFAPDSKKPTGSRIYQTTLKSLKLLPVEDDHGDVLPTVASDKSDPKGKRKADGPAANSSPSKRSAGQKKD